MSDLQTKCAKKLAFDQESAIDAALSYADEASPALFGPVDWHTLLRSGHLGGQRTERTRLAKIHELMLEVIGAAQGCSNHDCVLRTRVGGQGTNSHCKCKWNISGALAKLEREVEE